MASKPNFMTVTAANSSVFLTVDGLFSSAQQLEGFSTDVAVEVDAITPGVAEMGVDGKMSIAWVPTLKVLKLSFAADSPSRALMEDWGSAQDQLREVMPCNLVVNIPGIKKTYTYTKGVITSGTIQPKIGKTLAPGSWAITFESCTPAPL